MLAVIKTGGKQYLVREKDVIDIEKMEGEAGTEITFSDVLLLADEKAENVNLDKKKLADALVKGKIVEQGRAPKVVIVKQKPKKRYKLKKGHRQPFTRVEIAKIA